MRQKYVLITAARNEEAFIEETIRSVISQTILPEKWIIVSDGSTDRTDEIVERHAKERCWIELLRMPERRQRHYGGKAVAFNVGYARVEGLDYDFIGNLDADISFDQDHFQFLLEKFSANPALGVAGTHYLEEDCLPVFSFRDVAGQCQVFRRECLEQIGGYVPSKYGGIDNIAVITARMKGWVTRTFGEKSFFHHRPMSTAESNKWKAKMKHGREDYLLGNHPLWELLRIAYQTTKRPYLIGGLLLFWGYAKALVSHMERPISQELVRFQRREQMLRLRSILMGLPSIKTTLGDT